MELPPRRVATHAVAEKNRFSSIKHIRPIGKAVELNLFQNELIFLFAHCPRTRYVADSVVRSKWALVCLCLENGNRVYDKIHNGSGEIDEALHLLVCQNDVVRIEFVMASVCIQNVLRIVCIIICVLVIAM